MIVDGPEGQIGDRRSDHRGNGGQEHASASPKGKRIAGMGLNTQAEKKCNSATTRVVIGPNEGFQSETEVQRALKSETRLRVEG